jgi:hypothetical protein
VPQQPPRLPSRRDFDTTVAHPARVWDYWLGGKDNFTADREAGDRVLEAMPAMGPIARGGRVFLATAVHYLAAELGIRQFLDIGTGLPTANNTHEVAQNAAPEARIVYVDNDPIVLTHARALLTSDEHGTTAYIDADLRDTGKILAEARATLDFSQPVTVMLLAVLHFIPDTDDPGRIVAQLMEPLASGSYLVLSHASSDISADGLTTATRQYNRSSAVEIHMRSRAEVTRLLDGLEILEPGVVPLGQWHPGPLDGQPGQRLPTYTAVARKRLSPGGTTPPPTLSPRLSQRFLQPLRPLRPQVPLPVRGRWGASGGWTRGPPGCRGAVAVPRSAGPRWRPAAARRPPGPAPAGSCPPWSAGAARTPR